MEKSFEFRFKGRDYAADIHISLQSDGCYIFTIVKNQDLINEFGQDIDFKTDCEVVIQQSVVNDKLYQLQTAILGAAKSLPEFIF